jgi:hypothetical protein
VAPTSDPLVVQSSQVVVSKVPAPRPPIPLLASASNTPTSLPSSSKWATLQAELDLVAGGPGIFVAAFNEHQALMHITCKACSIGARRIRIAGDAEVTVRGSVVSRAQEHKKSSDHNKNVKAAAKQSVLTSFQVPTVVAPRLPAVPLVFIQCSGYNLPSHTYAAGFGRSSGITFNLLEFLHDKHTPGQAWIAHPFGSGIIPEPHLRSVTCKKYKQLKESEVGSCSWVSFQHTSSEDMIPVYMCSECRDIPKLPAMYERVARAAAHIASGGNIRGQRSFSEAGGAVTNTEAHTELHRFASDARELRREVARLSKRPTTRMTTQQALDKIQKLKRSGHRSVRCVDSVVHVCFMCSAALTPVFDIVQAVLHLIEAFYWAHSSDSGTDELTAGQQVVLDIVRNDMLANKHGRRWSKESKQLFAAMHIASPSATRTFVVNVTSPSLRTTTREIQVHKQPLAFGLRPEVLLAAGDTMHKIMALHSIPDGQLPLCVAADESGVTAVVRVVPLSKAAAQSAVVPGPQLPAALPKVVVVGTCGYKHDGVKHACCMETQALEVPEDVFRAADGFEALKSWLQGFTLASRTCT